MSKNLRALFTLLLLNIVLNQNLFSQISVMNTNNANQLAQKLTGPGVIISNASVLCNQNQSGIFVVTNANLGIDSGIVLTTGLAATNIPNYGVNGAQTNTATFNQGSGGDVDLTALAGVNTFDRCILEFDFKAKGDSIFFQYVFGSEEYPMYNCSNYNDVFGFFISGPGYPTPKNIALVPGTNIPVAINSVNNGVLYPGGVLSNCTNMGPGSPFTSLYTDNTGGVSVTYEGFTHLFTAKAAIQPCSTYHLKLAIADGFDHILDSGVFLKAGSLKSDNVKLSIKADSIFAGIPTVYEGCDTAVLKIHRQIFQANPGIDTVKLVITGTAQNGIDYNLIQTNYVFTNNLNDTIKNINIIPINDGIIEGTESIIIKLKDKCNNIIDSVTIFVKDPPTFKILNNDTTICQGSSVTINGVSSPGMTYLWTPQTGVANPNQLLTTLTPNATTTYILKGMYGNCAVIFDTIKITVQPSPTITLTPTNILCNGQNTGSILAVGTVGNNPLTFTLQPGGINANGSPHTFSNLAAGTYTITITSGLGCTKTATTTITQPNVLGWANVTAVNIACNAGNVGQVLTSASGGVAPINYTLNPGNITNGTGTFTGLAAGTYTVVAKDANNCSIAAVVAVTQAQSLTWANISKTNITCNGMANGTIHVQAAGGVGTINYTMNPGNVNNITGNFTNLGANIYTIQAVDANGCSATTTISITQFPPLLITNVAKVNVLCYGNQTGSITVTTTGGAPTIQYTLNPGAITNNTGIFPNITSGNYTISIVDANGCTASTSVIVTQPPALAYTNPAITNPTCVPGNNGSITVNITGGTPAYTYKIGAGVYQPGNTFNGLSAGTYTITTKDANGCTKSTIITLVNANAPTLTNNTNPPPCHNSLANINVTANNGIAPYTYTLQPLGIVNNNGQFTGVAPGIYTVNVVDANGCTASIVVNIVVPPQMSWSNFIINNLPCNGIGTGSIHATATGGTGTINYTLNPGNINNLTGTFPNLALNTYTVIATDANGCTISSVATIGISPALNFSPPTITNVLCNGGNNGSVQATANGGTGTKNYVITPGGIANNTGLFSNLTAGVYTVNVTDAVGCTSSTVITINQPTPLQITSVTSTPPSCVPGMDGSITVFASGGVPAYSYKINGVPYQGVNTFSALNIGTYTVTIKDANGCTTTSIFNLINPNAPSFANVTVNQANCAGANTGSIIATITGGVGPILYSITPLGIVNNNGVFNNLPVNVYTITATDANNCVVTTIASIVQPSALIWNVTNYTNISCNGMTDGAISVHASGGNGAINYTLMPGNLNNITGSFSPLVANNYTVTATDANGCTLTTTFHITNPAALNWNNFSQTNITCFNANNGSVQAPAIGGTGTIQYVLMPGNLNNITGSFNNLPTATYTVTATDANGCSITSSFSITSPTALAITNLVGTTPTCIPGNDATITVTASGGVLPYLYSINGNSPQASNIFTNIGVSNYTITTIDGNGCTTSSVINISNPASPTITNVSAINILCYGDNSGSITVTASGGIGALSYHLNPGAINNLTGVFSNLFANNYTVSVSDANGCSATSNIIVSQPPQLVWDSVNNRDIPCYGANNGLVTSSASGGTGTIVYTLLPPNVTNLNGAFFGLNVGVYTLLATDANGCVISAVFTINQAPQITWSNIANVPVSCYGGNNGSVSVQVAGGVGGFSYKLMPGNIINGTGIFNNLSSGNYTITVSDANNCTASTIIFINQASQVQLVNAAVTSASCNPGCDGSVIITASGGNGVYTYSINGGAYQAQNQFLNLCTGAYTISIKDGNGCTGTGTLNIATANGPNQINTTITNITCAGGNTGTIVANVVGGVGPLVYTLNPGAIVNNNGIFNNLTQGIYTISVVDANGCSLSSIITITQPAPLVITNITTNDVTCFGSNDGQANVFASGGNGLLTYQIQPLNITNNTGQFTNLNAATYTITITDANGCTITSVFNIAQPIQVQITNIINVPVSCNGGHTGSIQVTAIGGIGNINYNLMPGNLNNITGLFTGLSAINYTITASDLNGCSSSTTITITQPTPLMITQINYTPPSCVPGGDGSLTISASGATPIYTYSINGGPFQISNTITGLNAGTYTITVKDANGCTATSTANVFPPQNPTITNIAINAASCNPGCDGSVVITASGGNGGYTYALNVGPFQAQNQFSNLCIGTYTISVKDGFGCTNTATFNILTTNGPNQINATVTNIACAGGNTGQIIASVVGGVSPIVYTLNPGAIVNNNGIFNNLIQGVYTISVVDANGCSLSSIITITQPAPLIISNIVTNNVVCFGANNGQASVFATGGNGILTYHIQPLNITNNTGLFNGLSPASYTITVTDANGCTITSTINITQPPLLQFTNIINIPVSCNGGHTGSIQATASGGIGNINYNLMPGNLNNLSGSFTGLSAITYTITATDMNGCTTSTAIIITQPTLLVISQINHTPPTCVPGGDGSVIISASGATPTYTYSINGGPFQVSNTISGLNAGTYTITVKDANGCTTTSTVNVIPPQMPTISNIATTNATCNPGCDATLTVTSANGTGTHTYSLNGGTFQLSNQFQNLCVGVYTITVKDGSGCTVSSTANVNVYPSPLITNVIINNATCNNAANGSILLTVTGGNAPINYVLMPNNITNQTGNFNGLNSGVYTITGTDIYGCTFSTIVTVTQPSTLQFSNVTSNPSLCFNAANGSINCPVVGGTPPFNFTISPAGFFVAPNNFNGLLGNVTYTITVIDANGCSQSTSVYVAQPTQVVVNAISNTSVTCHGQSNGTLTATASGGVGAIQYTLMPNNITNQTGQFINLAGNTYTIIATDANGCTATSTSFLFEPTALAIANAQATDIVCFGQINGTITITGMGGINPLSYNLQPTNITNLSGVFTGLAQGVYTITITDANACTFTNTQTISEPTQVHFNGTTMTHVLCNGQNNGVIQTNASGGVGTINYTLNPGAINNQNGIFNNLIAGTYTIIATDGNGCSATTSAVILQPQTLDVVLATVKNISCHGGNDGYVIVSGSGGTSPYSYNLQPNGLVNGIGAFYSLTANNYKVVITDNNGCKDSVENILLTEPSIMNYTSVTHQDITCYLDSSGTISVVAQGGTGTILYTINPNTANQNQAGIFTNVQGGTYTITATDANGCTLTTTVTVLQNLQILSSNVDYIQPICFGDSNGAIQIQASGGVPPMNFSLNNSPFQTSGFFGNLSAGNYLITIKDSKNCLSDTLLILTEPNKVGANVDIQTPKCNDLTDGKLFVEGIGGRNNYTYKLRPGLNVNKNGYFYDVKEGVYTLTVIDSAGCSFDTLITMGYPINPLSLFFTKNNIGCFGIGTEGVATAHISGGDQPYTYLWNTNPVQTDSLAINLRIGTYGVIVTDANGCTISDSVNIEPGPCCEEIFIPTAFSPNGDGKNDIWRIMTAVGMKAIQLDVYDRWGNNVWSTTDPTKGWDGKMNGKDMDVDTYYYLLRYTCLHNGNNYMRKGDFTLIR